MQNTAMSESSITLLTALGKKKTLVMELVDFLSGKDEFKYGKEASQIRQIFKGTGLSRIVLICTRRTDEVLQELQELLRCEYPELQLETVSLDFDDIESASEDEAMRKKVYQAVERHAGPGLVISSAGRKTITQRIIEAGLLYGCKGYLSITAPGELSSLVMTDDLSIRRQSEKLNVLWISGRQFVEERRNDLIKDEIGDSFRSVYLFPRVALKKLMDDRIGVSPENREDDIGWIERLPKAELHCHLGGCQDEKLLKKLAATLLEDCEITQAKQEETRRSMEKALGVSLEGLGPEHLKGLQRPRPIHCLEGLDGLFQRCGVLRHEGVAVLIDALSLEQIACLSRDGRIDPATGHVVWPYLGNGQDINPLKWYMACGDLGGSALLQTERCLRLALSNLLDKATRENVRYIEIRCSPDNYTRAGLGAKDALEVLLDEAASYSSDSERKIQVNFLLMATRHGRLEAMDRHIALALLYAYRHDKKSGVVGFDLAGKETEKYSPSHFREIFMPLHRSCINITIHAGEMATEESIWQAIYILHARRIGHGLKLVNNRRMMDFVRDHDLSIEMCPSSNMQTNGFIDYWGEFVGPEEPYPLIKYLQHGIRVTVNTDNRFISDTTLSNEYLMAARMTEGGLNRWQILKLIKNGFKSAFLPKDQKDSLLKEIDQEIFNILLNDSFNGRGKSRGRHD